MLTGAEDADDSDGTMVDPMADLFFTLVAVVLPAILLVLPLVHVAADAFPEPSRSTAEALRDAPLLVEGREALALFAGADGLVVGGETAPPVAPDALLDSADLRSRLEAARDTGTPVLLVVEPAGQETAFLVDAVAAAHGPATLFQLRLDEACAFARTPQFAAACGLPVGTGQ